MVTHIPPTPLICFRFICGGVMVISSPLKTLKAAVIDFLSLASWGQRGKTVSTAQTLYHPITLICEQAVA